jgi:hypothetical protein
MPSRWEITLAGPADAAIPFAAPLAVVSGWLDDPPSRRARAGPPRVRQSAHDDQVRHWACGPLRTIGMAADGTSALTLQVRLLSDALDDRLRTAIEPGRGVRLGAHLYQIAAPLHQVEQASWEDLRRWTGARAWQIRFVTPASMRRNNRTSPLLAPEPLARGLAERWRRLHPQTAPPRSTPGTGPVWISDIDGHSETQIIARRAKRNGQWQMEEEIVSGFVGRIRYVCDQGTDADAADFDALMAFAAFAGAGSHTTHGLGAVVHEPTWQPPTARPARR